MTVTDLITRELTDEELEDYVDIAFALKNYQKVTPREKKKLKGLISYYRKKPHPFTSCVRDNTKRFGRDRAERICAVLKDLIKGTTKWRKGSKHMSEEEIKSFELDVDEIDINYMLDLAEEILEEDEIDFATGDVVWNPVDSFDARRRAVQEALNESYPTADGYSSMYWVEDISDKNALVCYKGTEYYVVPFSYKKGVVELGEEDNWTPVERAWIEANLSENPDVMAEMYFEDKNSKESDPDKEGLIWKPILREGVWKFSPGGGQKPIAKPITVVKTGKSDPKKLIISMSELKKNFEDGVIEHVTVPTSHSDKVLENTGYVRKLRFGKDEKGRNILEAGYEFTEPDVKEKVQRGTIANTSAGILFDYVHKETGKKHNAVLAHAALTNHPWLNGMKPFGVKTSENLQVVVFSEEPDNTDHLGGEKVAETTETPTFLQDLGLSEDEVRARLNEYEDFKKRDRTNTIEAKVRKWEEEKKAPVLVSLAKTMLSVADDSVVLHLSEEGKDKGLTADDIIDRFMEAAPALSLADDPVKEKDVTGEKPEEEEESTELSQEVVALARRLWFDEQLSEEDAIKEAKRRLKEKNKGGE